MFDLKLKKILDKLEPKIIIEFGIYDGKDTLKYRQWFPQAQIYGIEANPMGFDDLKKKLIAHNISCFNLAIGNKNGKNELIFSIDKVTGKWAGCGSILEPTSKLIKQANHLIFVKDKIAVDEITLERFCDQHKISCIDFMHIDVDGYIKPVIEGMGNIRPKVIYAEVIDLDKLFYGAASFNECNKLFKQMGYDEIIIHPEELAILYVRK